MNLINDDFTNLISKEFMSENVSLFLYSMIKCARPLNILEIGAGYSTLFLSKAVDDIRKENEMFSDHNMTENKLNFIGEGYNPRYYVVDNRSHPLYVDPLNVLESEGLKKYITFINDDINNFISNNNEFFDLIWMDFGSGEDYMFYVDVFFKRLNPGGFIIVHSTEGNAYGKLFVTELELSMNRQQTFEMMTVVEPHKKIQNSFTLIKKKYQYPVYTVYA